MVHSNTVIVNRSPQTAERFEKTSNLNSQSPQMQKCASDFQEIDDSEDTGNHHQTRTIYQIQNCGTVYMDSFNVHGVRMENCSNNFPQVTCSLFFPSLFPFSSNFKLAISYFYFLIILFRSSS